MRIVALMFQKTQIVPIRTQIDVLIFQPIYGVRLEITEVLREEYQR